MSKSLRLFIHTAGPNTALIKSSGTKEPEIVIGGRVLSIPILHRVDRLSLGLRTIIVRTTNGLTVNGVGVSVESACQIKIQGWSCNEENTEGSQYSGRKQSSLKTDISAVRLAAQHFLGKTDEQIEALIKRTISGHQRAIIGSLTVEELYRERVTFTNRVLELITADMRNMGLAVVSYTVADIADSNGYIEALGVTQTEKVKREAAEGASRYRNAARSRSSQLEAAAHLVVNTEMQRKIESDRERSVQELLAQQVVHRQSAIKEKAYAISSAEQDSVLLVKKKHAIAEETKAQLEVAKQEVEREKLFKERQINVEADAKLYKARKFADAERARAIADAERVKLIGQAEAKAIKARGSAEVEVLQEKIAAWHEATAGGALMEKLIQTLPKVAGAIAAPLARTEKMVFVNTGDSNAGGSGGSKMVQNVTKMAAEVPITLEALTGVNIAEVIASVGSSQSGMSAIQGAAEGVSNALTQQRMRSRS